MYPDFLIIPFQLLVDPNLTPTDCYVFAIIYWAEHLRNGKCTLSNKSIAEMLNKAKGSVANSISKLEKLGYIKVKLSNNQRINIKTNIAFKKIKVKKPTTNSVVNIQETTISRGGSLNNEGGSLNNEQSNNNINNNIIIINNNLSKDKSVYLSGLYKDSKELIAYWNSFGLKPYSDFTPSGNLTTGMKRSVEALLKRVPLETLKQAIRSYFIHINYGLTDDVLPLATWINFRKYQEYFLPPLSEADKKNLKICYDLFRQGKINPTTLDYAYIKKVKEHYIKIINKFRYDKAWNIIFEILGVKNE